MDPQVHIHPSNFQRREGEKSKHSNLQDTHTQETVLLSSIPAPVGGDEWNVHTRCQYQWVGMNGMCTLDVSTSGWG